MVASVVSYIVIDTIEMSHERDRLRESLAVQEENMREEVLVGLNSTLFYMANLIDGMGENLKTVTNEKVSEIAKILKLDELSFIDKDGVIRASTLPTLVGFGMADNPDASKFAGYMCLLDATVWATNAVSEVDDDGKPLKLYVKSEEKPLEDAEEVEHRYWFTQPPRESLFTENSFRKLCGIKTKDGVIQLGIDFARVKNDLKQHFAEIAIDWKVGENGYFILSDAEDGTVISNGDPESDVPPGAVRTPDKLADLGITDEMLKQSGEKDFSAVVSGKQCIVKSSLIPESGHRVCIVIPESELLVAKNMSVRTVFLVFFAVIVVVAFVSLHAVSMRERAEQVRIEEERRRNRDLALATTIQAASVPAVFPPFPSVSDRIDIFADMHPAKEVGGDFYDFYFVGEHEIAVIIADVSGKGVPGAMFMMRAKTIIKDMLSHGGRLGDTISAINEALCEGNDANMFVTAWVGILCIETGELTFVNCGHNAPYFKHSDGSIVQIDFVSGPPLAAFSGAQYNVSSAKMLPGDKIFLYTDGVTEAMHSGEQYGEKRLEEVLKNVFVDSKSLCSSVVESVKKFADGEEQADDITILSVGFDGCKRTFASTMEGLADATNFLRNYFGDPKSSIVIDEIASNIVRCSGSSTFDVSFSKHGGSIILEFADSGIPFNPLELPPPDINAPADKRQVGGLGIFMVRQLSESVSYKRDGDRNVLTVVMKN